MVDQAHGLVRLGEVTKRLTSRGRVSGYQIELWHDGLNEHRVLSDRDLGVLENKVQAHFLRWDEKYKKRLEKEERDARRQSGLQVAEEATAEAQDALTACSNILRYTLDVNDRVDWESLKSHGSLIREPKRTDGIKYDHSTGQPVDYDRAQGPLGHRPIYIKPKFGFFDHVFSSMRDEKEQRAQREYQERLEKWQTETDDVARLNSKLEDLLQSEQEEWREANAQYINRQQSANAEVDALRHRYERWDREDNRTVEEHAELVLNESKYPDWFVVDFDLGYSAETKTIIVEYRLPLETSMPSIKSVSYVQSRGELKKSFITKRDRERLYENVLYQIGLRTMHELYEADEIEAFDAIVFNGWVDSVDPATGVQSESCIMSVQTRREEFLALNLAEIEPRACYRALKGVSAAKLATLTPIRPILELDTGDRRFVDGRDVAQDISADSNLATMEWESFEHLVREIFEREFVKDGGEVKVTQASRDGGVDAIAFDPDPIRGGKYVIQAKRYTRTVGVAAVRDLYGTVMHEGADRGILVTTSDYGADSANFAKDKPLTLINGAQLLGLLEKHGHRARIDLKEARELRSAETA